MSGGARKVMVPLVALLASVALAEPAAGAVRSASERGSGGAAEVRLGHDVRLGQFSQAVVTVWTRCRPGFDAQELRIDLVQVGGERGSRTGDPGIVCDGAWHQLSLFVNTPEGGPFGPGWTRVSARLSVVDAATGAPAPPARDAVTDYVHAQVEVKISRDVRLGQEDAALVTVFVRCERPWVAQPMVVGVSQDDGFTFGSAVHDGIVCDDRWHRIDLRVFPSGERFHRGLTTVDASLDVLDPIDFDPVEQATDSVTVWVDAAADVKLARHARVEADGTLLLPVWARCQEPWVVQELSVDLFQEDSGAGGSASGDFGLSCDGRWHRVEVPVEPAPGPFLGRFVAHAFFTVLDPVSFDPVDQAQDTEVVDTPFSNGASNCLEDEDLNRFVSSWDWMLPGELLDQVQVESTCERTYTLLTFDQEVNVAIAPGASAIWGPAELTRFGVFHEPGVFVGAGNDLPGATTACELEAVVEIDYLLEADGTIVTDPCPSS